MSSHPSRKPPAVALPPSAPIARVNPSPDQLQRITVCTRPFRGAGPRVEAESVDGKWLLHNYGHGGAGWSLSWGTAAEIAALALTGGPEPTAVIGCGAMGLTTAVTLQRAGVPVTIFARELPPAVRSSRATGLWSPDSRVALAREADPHLAQRWEHRARGAWAEFQSLLNAPGNPVCLHERHVLSDLPPAEDLALRHREDPIGFAHLDHRLCDLYPAPIDRGPGEHPFRTPFARTVTTLRFDITALTQHLLAEFQQRGGTLLQCEFPDVAAMLRVPQRIVVNCTGWESHRLFGDTTLTPVRGQIAWLPPTPQVDYSLQWNKLSMVSRPDGTVVQLGASSDETGWNNPSEVPDAQEAGRALRLLAELQGQDML